MGEEHGKSLLLFVVMKKKRKDKVVNLGNSKMEGPAGFIKIKNDTTSVKAAAL